MSLTYPTALPANGALADGNELMLLFQAIQQKFGQINGTDVDPAGGFPDSMMATGSIHGNRIADKTVAQLQQGLRSVGTPELIDSAVTKAKMTTVVGSRPTLAQLEIASQTIVFSQAQGTTVYFPATPIPVATSSILSCHVSSFNAATGQLFLSVEISGANWVLRLENSAMVTCTGNIVIYSIANS